MKKLSLLFVFILAISSCDQDSIVTDMEEFKIDQKSINKKEKKVDICHKGKLINVSVNAIQAHRGHGDAVDMDGDGYFDRENGCSESELDCDDSNPKVNPGATEVSDNLVDDNCDGNIDEGGSNCLECDDTEGFCNWYEENNKANTKICYAIYSAEIVFWDDMETVFQVTSDSQCFSSILLFMSEIKTEDHIEDHIKECSI